MAKKPFEPDFWNLENKPAPWTLEFESLSYKGRKRLSIDSQHLDECLELIEREKIDSIHIFSYRYKKKSIEFIKNIKGLKDIHVTDLKGVDYSPIEQCPELEEVYLGDMEKPIDFSKLPRLKSVGFDWIPGIILPTEQSGKNLVQMHINSPKSDSLEVLPYYENLERMRIGQGQIRSLSGLERFKKLRCYEHYYGRTLVDISAIAKLPKLEQVRFENCPKIEMEGVFKKCHALELLMLYRVPDLPSLSFLKKMKSINHVRLDGCCVLDGDMTPLLALDEFIYSPSKKYYNHSEKELLAIHKEMKAKKEMKNKK